MEIEEAVRLLGLLPGDEREVLRQKYHEQLRLFHPDQVGDHRGTAKTQELNEAYALLKANWSKVKCLFPKGRWMAGENRKAYRERRILMLDAPFGEEIVLDTGYRGRYYWNREMEPFRLFLASVGEAAVELLGLAGGNDALRGKLLHLLIQEYIHPLTCLEAMAEAKGGGEYHLRCHMERGKDLDIHTLASMAVAVRETRIYGLDEQGMPRGQVSFSEDALYYVVTPLLRQGVYMGRLQMGEERSGIREKKKSPSHVPATLVLTPTGKPWRDPSEKINREIRRVLGSSVCKYT